MRTKLRCVAGLPCSAPEDKWPGPEKLAGELGFEPRRSVLETDSLAVELTPPVATGRGMNAGGLLFPVQGSLFPVPCFNLLRLFVVRVLAAGIAELRELKPARGRLLVLRRRVVPVLARRTLQCDNFAHFVSSPNVASHLGWQAACSMARRDTGLVWPLLPILNCPTESGAFRPRTTSSSIQQKPVLGKSPNPVPGKKSGEPKLAACTKLSVLAIHA